MYTVMFDQVYTFLHLFLSLVDLTGLLEDKPVSHFTQRQHTAALYRGFQHRTQHTWGGGEGRVKRNEGEGVGEGEEEGRGRGVGEGEEERRRRGRGG